MTTKTLSERIAEAEALLAELKRDMKPESVSDGRPEIGQDYWFIDGYGIITKFPWDRDEFDLMCLSIGNVHLTREAAEREVERRKVMVELRKLAKGFKPDWENDDQEKWVLVYDNASNKWVALMFYYCLFPNQVPFATEENASAARKALGDRLNVLKED